MGVNELTSDELYESGARACLAGRAIWACPVLSAESHQAQSWRTGWQTRRRAATWRTGAPRHRLCES
jgi:hypothetical protein